MYYMHTYFHTHINLYYMHMFAYTRTRGRTYMYAPQVRREVAARYAASMRARSKEEQRLAGLQIDDDIIKVYPLSCVRP